MKKNRSFFKLSNLNQTGFTIVEILVVAAILGVIGYMMSDIVARSLSGSQKTAVIGATKQNGQVALDAINQAIRNSDQVACLDGNWTPAGGSGNTIVLYGQDGRYVRFRFVSVGGQNGYFSEDFPDGLAYLFNQSPYATPPISVASNTSSRLLCVDPSAGVPLRNQVILTDTNLQNGVNICRANSNPPCVGSITLGDDVFTVSRNPGSNDSVTVQFGVNQALNAGTGFENTLASPTQFRETVQLR